MEASVYIRFILVLILVLGLIMALTWFLRRMGLGDGARGPLTRRRRVRVIESAMLDGRHKVVLVRRDDVEHLLLVGPNTSQVIERHISAPAGEPPAAADAPSLGTTFRQFLGKDAQS